MSIESAENILEALFDPSGDLIELSTPLASPHSDMDMIFTRALHKKSWSGEYYDLLSGDLTHRIRPTSPLIEDRDLDAQKRAEKSVHYTYQEEKSQYDDQSSEPPSARVNATFTRN